MANVPLNQLKMFHEQISRYSQPEELFGELGGSPSQQQRQLESSFRSLMKLYHPDGYSGQPAALSYVNEISKTINALHQRAVEKIRAGSYGEVCDYQGVIQTAQHDYFVTELLVEGALADIYRAYYLERRDSAQPRKDVVIKIITDPARNELVDQETAFYLRMSHFCFAQYVESFRTPQGKKAIVLSYAADSYDLIELAERYRQAHHTPGVPQEHLVWILDRYLCALGLLHENRILHGNIQPDNLVIQPKNHNGLLIDFLHCRIDPDPEDVFSVVNPIYCAPEVLTRRFKPHPVSDIYALGICMIEMLGGRYGKLDDSIVLHPSLRQFLQKMILPDPAKRADDAWALAGALKQLRQKIYGANPNFIPLELGGSNGRR